MTVFAIIAVGTTFFTQTSTGTEEVYGTVVSTYTGELNFNFVQVTCDFVRGVKTRLVVTEYVTYQYVQQFWTLATMCDESRVADQ